jgi:hypothetical protein
MAVFWQANGFRAELASSGSTMAGMWQSLIPSFNGQK